MMLDNNAADILSLDAGEVFVAGRYHSLIPLMQQLFEGNLFTWYCSVMAFEVIQTLICLCFYIIIIFVIIFRWY